MEFPLCALPLYQTSQALCKVEHGLHTWSDHSSAPCITAAAGAMRMARRRDCDLPSGTPIAPPTGGNEAAVGTSEGLVTAGTSEAVADAGVQQTPEPSGGSTDVVVAVAMTAFVAEAEFVAGSKAVQAVVDAPSDIGIVGTARNPGLLRTSWYGLPRLRYACSSTVAPATEGKPKFLVNI